MRPPFLKQLCQNAQTFLFIIADVWVDHGPPSNWIRPLDSLAKDTAKGIEQAGRLITPGRPVEAIVGLRKPASFSAGVLGKVLEDRLAGFAQANMRPPCAWLARLDDECLVDQLRHGPQHAHAAGVGSV